MELYQAVARAKEGGDVAIGVRLLVMALEAGLEEVRHSRLMLGVVAVHVGRVAA